MTNVHKKSTTKYYGQISRKKKTPKKNISISPTHNMTYLLGMSSSDSDSKTGALHRVRIMGTGLHFTAVVVQLYYFR